MLQTGMPVKALPCPTGCRELHNAPRHFAVLQTLGMSVYEHPLGLLCSRCSFPSPCGALHYGADDPLTTALSPTPAGLWAWHFVDLQLVLSPDGTAAKATVAPGCHRQLPNATRLGKSDSAMVSALTAAPPRSSCKVLAGDWFIVSDRKGERSCGLVSPQRGRSGSAQSVDSQRPA